jgi:hypothetical protein
MPSSFTPAFIGLTGVGNTLGSLNASIADAAAGRFVQGQAVAGGPIVTYQVRSGTDPISLPGIVPPANFDSVNNPVVFVLAG